MANTQITPWVRITPDGTITILSAGAEMGHGSMTSLPLIAAERGRLTSGGTDNTNYRHGQRTKGRFFCRSPTR